MNGWTKNNHELRKEIVKCLDKDIFCVNETHLKENDNLSVEDYLWYGNNRRGVHRRAVKGSGGVGMFVKQNLLKQYQVTVIDRNYDGVLGVLFKSIEFKLNFIIYTCYLPPESSPWADPTAFYGHLMSQIYLNSEVNFIIICGDFNARIGKESDTASFDPVKKSSISRFR